MKKKAIIIVSAIFVLSISALIIVKITRSLNPSDRTNSLTYIYDESVYIPEPENTSEPDYAYWDPRLGQYVNTDLMYYDSSEKSYKLKTPPKVVSVEASDNERLRQEKWHISHLITFNRLDSGIKKWHNRKPKLTRSSMFSSTLVMNDSGIFKNSILALGIDYLPDMLEYVMVQKLWCWPMSSAAEEILNIDCANFLMYDSEEKHDIWRSNFISKINMVNISNITEVQLDSFGLLALPFIEQKLRPGEMDFIEFYNKNSSALALSGFTEFENYDDVSEWFSQNAKKISIIVEIVQKYRNYSL